MAPSVSRGLNDAGFLVMSKITPYLLYSASYLVLLPLFVLMLSVKSLHYTVALKK